MPDAVELMKTIKKAAVDAVNAAKPAEICFGKVTRASPLQILVEQKMTLGKSQLVFSRNATDYSATVLYTDENGEHTRKITVKNGLTVGDEVILIRQQGGQKYIVWDRVGT